MEVESLAADLIRAQIDNRDGKVYFLRVAGDANGAKGLIWEMSD